MKNARHHDAKRSTKINELELLASAKNNRRDNHQCRFGEELYRLRAAVGLKQFEVAVRAKLARGYYSQLENSKRSPPPIDTLLRIAAAIGMTESESQNLSSLADEERSCVVIRPSQFPIETAIILRKLAANAHCLSPNKLQEVAKLLAAEETAM